MRLTVATLALEDTWKDIVRIKRSFRKDIHDQTIPRASICRITVGNKYKWVILYGREPNDAIVQMDLNVRLSLNVEAGQEYDFRLERLGWIKSLWFPWRASDPMYRLPAQLSLVSFIVGVILGVLGILVSFWPITKESCPHDDKVATITLPSS